jgi:hypothetical protein
MKFHYVRRYKLNGGQAVDLGIVDIPEKDLEITLKANPLWIDLGLITADESSKEEIKEKETEPEKIECPICGFVAKNDKSLRMHKMKSHK